MLRFAHMRTVALPLVIMIALTVAVLAVSRAKPEVAPSTAPAPIDQAVPAHLSTATFGMG